MEHGFKRSRWRSLRRQQIQDLLIAAIQNLKIYLRRAVAGATGGFAGLLQAIGRDRWFTWSRPAPQSVLFLKHQAV